MVCALLNACTTTRAIPMPERGHVTQLVRPGDHVKCTLRSGELVEFKVARIEPTALASQKRTIELKDIARLEVRRFSPRRTALLVVLVAGLGAAGVALSDFAVFPAVTWP